MYNIKSAERIAILFALETFEDPRLNVALFSSHGEGEYDASVNKLLYLLLKPKFKAKVLNRSLIPASKSSL